MFFKRVFVLSFMVFICTLVLAQKNILFVIDSVAYYNNAHFHHLLGHSDMFLFDDEIGQMYSISDSLEIEQLGFDNYEKVVFIETVAKLNRTEHLKSIPNFKQLILMNALFYKQSDSIPYTGPFVDYYVNGIVKRRGNIKNGLIDGFVSEYDKSGKKVKEIDYWNGIQSHSFREFWPNGLVKLKIDGLFGNMTYYSSDGSVLSEYRYKDNVLCYSRLQKKTFKTVEELIPIDYFTDNNNYNNFLRDYSESDFLLNPNSYRTYLFLGEILFYYGEISSAIAMFDMALSFEPDDFNSRVSRLYTQIFRVEQGRLKTIKHVIGEFEFSQQSVANISEVDFFKICEDVKWFKQNGYSKYCESHFEDIEGFSRYFSVPIVVVENEYCTN